MGNGKESAKLIRGKSGQVWHFKTYDKRPEFAQVKHSIVHSPGLNICSGREARAARRGPFPSENPEKPWDWSRDQHSANVLVVLWLVKKKIRS